MSPFSRRALARVLLFGAPIVAAVSLSGRADVPLGASTHSYRDLFRVTGLDNVDDVVKALKASGVSIAELAAVNVEPAGPDTGPAAPPRPAAYPVQTVVLSPEQVAAAKTAVRERLRRWRLNVPEAWLEQVRARFYAENIAIASYAVEFEADFTDTEIDAVFGHAKKLGAPVISSPMTLAMAARVAPFASRHAIPVAIHTQPTGNTAGRIAANDLDAALAISPALAVKLDIGHLTASNLDAAAVLRQHLPRVALVNVQDRLRNGGRSEPLGEGDTPIADVMRTLAAAPTRVPAIVEYSYSGLGSSAVEVRASLAYLKQALK